MYVDDFKVAGIKDNLPKIWQMLTDPELGNLHLDPPQDLVDNVYLGTKQTMCQLPEPLIKEKNELYRTVCERSDGTLNHPKQKSEEKD